MPHCDKQVGNCCDCPNRLSEDVSVSLDHWQTNFEFQGWHFWYGTLEEPGMENYLCKYGRCRVCGKCLCLGVTVPAGQSTDSFLAAAYRWMYQLWSSVHKSYANFREAFAAIFHEEDQPFVRHWLSLPGNQHILQMYRHDAKGRDEAVRHVDAQSKKGLV